MPRTMIPFDYSTINLERLRQLPRALVRGRLLQEISHLGNGCFLDAPGYPTYFTRSVYTSRGDTPGTGPYMVITDPDDPELHYDVDGVNLRDLWVPLPYPQDTPHFSEWIYGSSLEKLREYRLWKWIHFAYIYCQHGYADPKNGEQWRHADKLIFRSGPATPGDLIFCPEHHAAVLAIQEFYPEHQPDLAWIENVPESEKQNDWWERYSDPTLTVKPGEVAAYRWSSER